MPQWISRYKWLLLSLAALVALLVFTAACGDDDDDDDATATETAAPTDGETTAPAGEPLKIGVLMAFTGDLSDFGPPILQGIEVAVDEINAGGGVLGQPIEIVQGNTATDATTGVAEAERLIQVEGVSAIIGALSSGVSIAIAESATVPNDILQISPASTAPTVTEVEDNDFLFRTVVQDATQGVALAYLADDLSFTSACTMFVNNDYGQGLSGVFAESFAADFGGTVTAEVPTEQEQVTYATEVGQCAGGAPEAMVVPAYPESAGVFLREAVEDGTITDFIFTDGTKSEDMFATLGWDTFDGMLGTIAGGPTPAGDDFDAALEAKFGSAPGPYAREGSDAVYTIALAAQKAGSTDSAAIRDALRDVSNPPGEVWIPGTNTWDEALQMLADGVDLNYEGASGSVDYDDNGDVVGTVEIWRVDAATETLVTDRIVAVDLATKEVTVVE